MVARSPLQKALHKLSELGSKSGTEINRQCVVDEVKEEGGERKFRAIMGYTPDGKPWLSPWMCSQEHRSGGQRSQDKVKKGQNMTIQGPSFRTATATAGNEAEHAPQPPHAMDTNGESMAVGGKLRTALHGGKEEDEGGGQSGGSGGGGGGQQQQKGDEYHYQGSWIAKEKEQLKKYQPGEIGGSSSTGSRLSGGGGGGGGFGGQQAQQGQQGQQKEDEMALQSFMHEKKGHHKLWGEGEEAIRFSVEKEGGQVRAGKKNWLTTMDKGHTLMRAAQNNHCDAEGQNCVNKPWVIMAGPTKNPLKVQTLKDKKGGGGGGGGGASA